MSNSLRPVILALATALIFSVQADAQPNAGPIIGLHLGGSSTTLVGDDVGDLESILGLKAGASAAFSLSGNLGVQTGVDYTEKGAALADSDFDEKLKIDYVEVPILLRYGIPVDGPVSPHVVAGTAVSFNIGCEFTEEFEGQSASFDCEDEGLEAASIDVGLMAGAGVSYAVSGPMAVTLEILYNFGLTNVDAGDDPLDVANRAWAFLLGIEFPILR